MSEPQTPLWAYHYSAILTLPDGSQQIADGIATTNQPIASQAQYDAIKRQIQGDAATCAITALTLLHQPLIEAEFDTEPESQIMTNKDKIAILNEKAQIAMQDGDLALARQYLDKAIQLGDE